MFATDFKAWLQQLQTDAGDRVFLDAAPQEAPLPYIVITQAQGGSYYEHLDGAAGVASYGWHLHCYAATRSEANDLAEAVRKQLHRYRGTMGATFVDDASGDGTVSTEIDRPVDANYAPRYVALQFYDIHHTIAEV